MAQSIQVTITGADDKVDLGALNDLSDEFPWVEWAILYSKSRRGTPRYPTLDWCDRLLDRVTGNFHVAAHLCGSDARQTVDQGFLPWYVPDTHFRRVQINGYVSGQGNWKRIVEDTESDIEFILQARSAETLSAAIQDTEYLQTGLIHASVLYDPSGGRGIALGQESSWLVTKPPKGVRVGYAGGISHDNVEAILDVVNVVEGDTWIDMESGVRTDDVFDLEKVRDVLEKTARWKREHA